ncbi:MAG TPA: trypsin-like serine protease [Polyangiaceae bacterium]
MKPPGEEARRSGARHVREGVECAPRGFFRAGGWLVLLSALALAACIRMPGRQAKTAPAAFGEASERGEPLGLPLAVTTEEDYVVRVVVGSVTCTGSLIEEDRVLTAHHCVVERDKNGQMLPKDVAAEDVHVELGGDPFAWGEVGVRAVIAPTCGHAAGEGDIAILVLERRLVGVATRRARIAGPPVIGRDIEPIGFGRCVFTQSTGGRAVRVGGAIEELSHRRFRLDASICPGDSGGPAVETESGDIIGVISAAVMDASDKTLGRSEFTRLDSWAPLFTQAQLVVDGMSPAELPPVDCR